MLPAGDRPCYQSKAALNGTCFGTGANPGDQINTHEFARGLLNPPDARFRRMNGR